MQVCVCLLAASLLVCMLLVSWDQLDHHVFSHIRSFTRRYLVDSYDFLNSSFAISSPQRSRTDGPDVAGGRSDPPTSSTTQVNV